MNIMILPDEVKKSRESFGSDSGSDSDESDEIENSRIS